MRSIINNICVDYVNKDGHSSQLTNLKVSMTEFEKIGPKKTWADWVRPIGLMRLIDLDRFGSMGNGRPVRPKHVFFFSFLYCNL